MNKVRKGLIIMFIIFCIFVLLILVVNFYVIISTKNKIVSEKQSENIKEADCILILGAGIWGDKPSPMLEDRLKQGISLYKQKVAPKIIMSGDHSKKDYNEVAIMKEYAIKEGVPSEDIFMDHAGFSTYDSVYRAKEIFGANKMVIVTQKYHLYRALYISKKIEIDSYGVASNLRIYPGQFIREIREIFARDKDVLKCITKPMPTFLGEKISLDGNGDITND